MLTPDKMRRFVSLSQGGRWMSEGGEPLGVTFGPDRIAQRPELAVKISQIANAWAVLEANMGACLGVLMRADPKAAIAMLSKVQTATAKSQAIREVGKAVLSDPDLKQLKELLKKFDAIGKRRNVVVHGMWGTTPEWPEHLVWAPPEVTTNTILGLLQEHLDGKGEDYLEQQKELFVVWSAHRFDELFDDIKELITDVVRFVSHQQMASFMGRVG